MSLLSLLGIGIAEAATDATTTTTTVADTATTLAPHHTGGVTSTILMLVVFIIVFYFLLIRPQTKRAKEHKRLMDSLSIGDEVVTAGGILGRITKLRDNYVSVAVANGIEITVQKASVVNILPKGTLETN